LHISLGLTAAIAIVAQFLVRIVLFAVRATQGRRNWRCFIKLALRPLVYFFLTAMILTGLLGAVLRGERIYFWEIPLPFWDANDLSEQLQAAHWIAAYALAGSILASLVAAIVNFYVVPASSDGGLLRAAARPSASIATVVAERLAQKFRFFGRFAFWLQFLLGFLSAATLTFSFAGASALERAWAGLAWFRQGRLLTAILARGGTLWIAERCWVVGVQRRLALQ
jgi:hypothetical protein